MTFYDEMRDLSDELAGEFLVPAKLIRVEGGHDPRTDRSTRHEFEIECRAVLGSRKTRTDNGLLVMQTIATLTAAPKEGDKLQIGPSTYTVTSVEERAPDGIAINWTAVLR